MRPAPYSPYVVQPQQGQGPVADISTIQTVTGMPGVNELDSYYNPALLQKQPQYTNYKLLDKSQVEPMEQNYYGNTGSSTSSCSYSDTDTSSLSSSSSGSDTLSVSSINKKRRPRRRRLVVDLKPGGTWKWSPSDSDVPSASQIKKRLNRESRKRELKQPYSANTNM